MYVYFSSDLTAQYDGFLGLLFIWFETYTQCIVSVHEKTYLISRVTNGFVVIFCTVARFAVPGETRMGISTVTVLAKEHCYFGRELSAGCATH